MRNTLIDGLFLGFLTICLVWMTILSGVILWRLLPLGSFCS